MTAKNSVLFCSHRSSLPLPPSSSLLRFISIRNELMFHITRTIATNLSAFTLYLVPVSQKLKFGMTCRLYGTLYGVYACGGICFSRPIHYTHRAESEFIDCVRCGYGKVNRRAYGVSYKVLFDLKRQLQRWDRVVYDCQ